MTRPPAADRLKRKRIALILRIQSQLFDDPVYGFRHAAALEFEKLLSLEFRPRASQIRQLLSMIRSYELMVGKAPSEREEYLHKQLAALVQHLKDLLKALPPETPKRGPTIREIVSRPPSLRQDKLGISFFRRGLGLPLFGFFRPGEVPSCEGILFCFEAPPAAGGVGRIDAVWKEAATRIEYRGLGITLASSAAWLHCLLAPSSRSPEPAHLAAFRRNEPERFSFLNCSVTLARKKVRNKIRNKVVAPYLFRYAYFFPVCENQETNFVSFVKTLFNGRFGIPARDSKDLAELFKRRLLE